MWGRGSEGVEASSLNVSPCPLAGLSHVLQELTWEEMDSGEQNELLTQQRAHGWLFTPYHRHAHHIEESQQRKRFSLTSLCLRCTVIRGEPDRFWDRVGGGDTSREIRWLATDSRQSLQFTASGMLGNQWK